MMKSLAIHWKRFLIVWFLFFGVLFGLSFLLYTFYVASSQIWFLLLLQILPPIVYLVFGWIYFRTLPLNDWKQRMTVASVWIVFTIVATAVLLPVVYGVPITDGLTIGTLQGAVLNFVAIVLGGFLAHHVPQTTPLDSGDSMP